MSPEKIAAGRHRLQHLHDRGEKATKALEAVAMVVSGAMAFLKGLRALLDIASPPKDSDKDDEN